MSLTCSLSFCENKNAIPLGCGTADNQHALCIGCYVSCFRGQHRMECEKLHCPMCRNGVAVDETVLCLLRDAMKGDFWSTKINRALHRPGHFDRVREALTVLGVYPVTLHHLQNLLVFPEWPDDEDTVWPDTFPILDNDTIDEIRQAVENVRDAMNPQEEQENIPPAPTENYVVDLTEDPLEDH